jgi:predicted Zn-dependent protease
MLNTNKGKGFIPYDANNNPITDGSAIVSAFTRGSTIRLNPTIYSTSPTYDSNKFNVDKYGVIQHEVGHDLGLNHPEGAYPFRLCWSS